MSKLLATIIAELVLLEAQATPAPWSLSGFRSLLRYGRKTDGPWCEADQDAGDIPDDKDASFLVELRHSFHDIVKGVDALKAERDRAEERAGQWMTSLANSRRRVRDLEQTIAVLPTAAQVNNSLKQHKADAARIAKLEKVADAARAYEHAFTNDDWDLSLEEHQGAIHEAIVALEEA